MANKKFVVNVLQGISKYVKKTFTNPFEKAGISWLDLRILKNSNKDVVRSTGFFGKRLFFKNRDELLHSLREIFIEEIYKINLPASPFIIDCGANIGISVIYLKMNYPDAYIIAFEPDETNFLILEKNINSLQLKNVESKKEAVWTENTVLQFSNDGTESSKVQTGTNNTNTVQVKARRLYDIINKPIDFLKIDIEGAEFPVLKDIESKLHLVNNMFFEYHGTFQQIDQLNEVFQLLRKNGFYYYIKETFSLYPTPFVRKKTSTYDIQLNIFCFKSA